VETITHHAPLERRVEIVEAEVAELVG